MDKSRLIDSGCQTRWKIEEGSNYVDRHWEAIKNHLLAITGLLAPLYRLKRKGLWQRWRSRITRATKRIHRHGYRDYLRYIVKTKRMSRIQRKCRITYEERISGAAKSNPKAHYNNVQSKATLLKALNGVQHQQVVR